MTAIGGAADLDFPSARFASGRLFELTDQPTAEAKHQDCVQGRQQTTGGQLSYPDVKAIRTPPMRYGTYCRMEADSAGASRFNGRDLQAAAPPILVATVTSADPIEWPTEIPVML